MSTSLRFQRLLINSMPKSGTHLLARAVEQCGYRPYLKPEAAAAGQGYPWLLNYRQALLANRAPHPDSVEIQMGVLNHYLVDQQSLRQWLQALPTPYYIKGHVPYTPQLAPLLESLQMGHLLIIRDPRAVLVSLLDYIPVAAKTSMGAHFLAEDFAQLNRQQQLQLLLNGGEAPYAGVEILPYRQVYQSMVPWLEDPHTLAVKFEALVGSQGGGSDLQQYQSRERIEQYLAITASQGGELFSREAETFKQGSIEGWRQRVTPQQAEQIDHYCATLCLQAGYYPN